VRDKGTHQASITCYVHIVDPEYTKSRWQKHAHTFNEECRWL